MLLALEVRNQTPTNSTNPRYIFTHFTFTISALQTANKNLMECLVDVYEPDWPGSDQVPVKAQSLEIYWEDLCHKLNDQVTIPLSTYLSQFSEIRVSNIRFWSLPDNSPIVSIHRPRLQKEGESWWIMIVLDIRLSRCKKLERRMRSK